MVPFAKFPFFWVNCSDLSRPHPKWWFMCGIAPQPPCSPRFWPQGSRTALPPSDFLSARLSPAGLRQLEQLWPLVPLSCTCVFLAFRPVLPVVCTVLTCGTPMAVFPRISLQNSPIKVGIGRAKARFGLTPFLVVPTARTHLAANPIHARFESDFHGKLPERERGTRPVWALAMQNVTLDGFGCSDAPLTGLWRTPPNLVVEMLKRCSSLASSRLRFKHVIGLLVAWRYHGGMQGAGDICAVPPPCYKQPAQSGHWGVGEGGWIRMSGGLPCTRLLGIRTPRAPQAPWALHFNVSPRSAQSPARGSRTGLRG